MKNNLKIVVSFALGALIFGGLGAYASIKIQANEIGYKEGTVESALNDLYSYDLVKYTSWFNMAGISSPSYKDNMLSILNSSQINQLFNTETAVNYLSNDTDLLHAVLSNNTTKSALLNSPYVGKVPTMTSNTTPNGEAFASSEFSADYGAWRAFDGNNSTDFAYVGNGSMSIGYKFTKPIQLFRIELKMRINGEGINNATLYYSDDGENYTQAYDTITLAQNQNIQSFDVTTTGKHLYWKIYSTSGYNQNGGLSYLQFYGM